jgi:hypothetical protein
MAQADWTAFNATTHHGLDDGDVAKGVSNAFTKPNGGGDFVHAFHSLQPTIGVAGWYYSGLSAFNPIATNKGGSIRAAMNRYAAGTKYAPVIGFMAGTDLAAANAYVLGLSDSDPYQIVLRKGMVTGGLDPTAADVLRASDESWSSNTKWLHLRLDIIVNPQGDVVLNVSQNDLDVNTVDSPAWQVVSGMDSFIDDAGGVLTGTAPLIAGFRGFFGHFNNGEAGKVSLFDHVELLRQLSP